MDFASEIHDKMINLTLFYINKNWIKSQELNNKHMFQYNKLDISVCLDDYISGQKYHWIQYFYL